MARIYGADRLASALDKHVALVGFMGAGKTTMARELALRTHLNVSEADRSIEHQSGRSVVELFAESEATFRQFEEHVVRTTLLSKRRLVVDLGGGAVTSAEVRDELRKHAMTVWLDVDVDTCWERVRGSDRPLAQDETEFRRLYEERRPLYRAAADVVAHDADDVILAAAGVHVERGALQRLGDLVPGDGKVALVSDSHVAGIHGMDAQLALGARLTEMHELPPGEEAKTLAVVDRLWQDLRLDRRGTVVALGGGCTTDAAGWAASAYLRGVAWVPGPVEPRRAGGRCHRRQDRHRPAAGQEPRRLVPLARPHRRRPGAPRHAARAAAA